MTFEEVGKKYEDAEATRSKIDEEISKLEAEKRDLLLEAQNAAESGDLDEYIRISDKAKRAEAMIFVKRAQQKKIAVPTANEIRTAWDDYAKKHEAAMKKRLAAYEKARRDLFKQYSDLVDAQSVANGAREKCAEWLGRKLRDLDDGEACGLPLFNLPGTEPLQGLSYRGRIWCNPEGVFFSASKVAPENWDNTVFRVVHRHRSS